MSILAFLILVNPSAQLALASSTNTTRLKQDAVVNNEALIRRFGANGQARVYLNRRGWEGILGDLDGNGWADKPNGIDAISYKRVPIGNFDLRNVLISSNSNSATYSDGDILRWVPLRGFVPEVSEEEIKTILQVPSSNIDIDSICWIEDGVYWLSLRDNLSGSVLGEIKDGDVFLIDTFKQSTKKIWSEDQVQAMVEHALGITSPFGDLIALATLPNGEYCFVVQSPSTHDAGIIAASNGGHLVPGWEEHDWGFQEDSEIDGLCFLPGYFPQPPVLTTDLSWVDRGQGIRFKVRFAEPNCRLMGFRTLQRGFFPNHLGGIGFLGLDAADPWLFQQYQNGKSYPVLVDTSGSATFDWIAPNVPIQVASFTMYFQVLGGNTGLSAPISLKLM